MVGNSLEMLLYLSYNEDAAEVLRLTPSRLRLLRNKITKRNVSEDYVIDALERLGCKCIRPRVILPCIVKDKNGRLYDECTYMLLFFTQELADKYEVDYKSIIRHAELGHSTNRALLKHVLHKRRAWIVMDNYVLDSVWSYEPIELDFTKRKVEQLRDMLSNTIPSTDNPHDILWQRRAHPATWKPQEID